MFKAGIEILKKDLKLELRSRYALNSLLMFILVLVCIFKFALGEEKISGQVHAGIIWALIFFTCTGGLSRAFVSEEEKGTSAFLKLTTNASSVILGKLFFNVLLSFLTVSALVLLYILLTDLKIADTPLFILILFLGTLGLSVVLTIISSLISKANSKGNLYPVLSFPLILPLMLSSINSTIICIEGTTFFALSQDIILLISYVVVVTTASFMLFPFVWQD